MGTFPPTAEVLLCPTTLFKTGAGDTPTTLLKAGVRGTPILEGVGNTRSRKGAGDTLTHKGVRDEATAFLCGGFLLRGGRW